MMQYHKDSYQNDDFIKAVKDRNYIHTESLLQKGGFDVDKQFIKWLDGTDTYYAAYTVLHYAAYEGDSRMAGLLLQYNAHVNIVTTRYGRTPLHCAVMSGDIHTIGVLLRYHADVDKTDKDGSSALYYAVNFNKVKATEFLIKNGADVNQVGYKDCTALHRAAFQDSPKCALVLLQHGADVTLVNNKGKTPMMIAEQYNKEATADIIIRFIIKDARPGQQRKTQSTDDEPNDEANPIGFDNSPRDNHNNIARGYTPVIALLSPDKSEILLPQLSDDDAIGISYKHVEDSNQNRKLPSNFLAKDPLNVFSMQTNGKPSELEINRLAGQIGHEWSSIALELRIPFKEVEQLEMTFPNDPRRRILQMLMMWRERVQDMSETKRCEVLKEALVTVGRTDLANDTTTNGPL